MFTKNVVKALFVALLVVVLFASCKSEVEIPIYKKYHTITFNTNGGTDIESTKVERGSLLKEESFIPEKEGYIFKEWKTEDGFVYDFLTPVTEDITLYANYYIEADDDVEKKMYSLYLISRSLYEYDDEEKEKTVLDAFGEKCLLEITGALYGDNDGFISDTYFTEDGSSEKYYLYSEEYESIYDKDTYSLSNLESLNFELKDYDNTSTDKTFLIEVKNLGFKADFTEPKRTITVNLDATLKLTFDSEINNIERYDLNLVSNGETYNPFSFEYKEDGYLALYDDYFYSHVHSFGEWIVNYPPSEGFDGQETRSCDGCGFSEERSIPKLNERDIRITVLCEKTYDGKPIDISSSSLVFSGNGDPIIEYKKKGEGDDKYSIVSPRDVGEYSIRITLEPDDEYERESKLEADYKISKIVLANEAVSGIFKGEDKVYNGENQVWEAKITNKDTRGISAFSDIVDGETITIRLTSHSKDVENKLQFNYNYNGWTSPGGTIEVLDDDGSPLHNYELSICNETVKIVPIKLQGEISITKQFDRSSDFITNDLSSLEGVLDCDKDLVLEACKLNDFTVGLKDIDYIRFYLNGSPTNNYTIESSQIKAEIVKRVLTLGEYGGTIRTPLLPSVDNRAIALEKRNNTIKTDDKYETGYLIIASSDGKISSANNGDIIKSTELNYELNISYDSYYTIGKPLPNLAFINVEEPMESLRSVKSLGEDSYCVAFFNLDSGKKLVINIEKGVEGDLVPYICDDNGKHRYYEYSKDEGSHIVYDLSGKSYFFLYSKSGTSNIELTFEIQ